MKKIQTLIVAALTFLSLGVSGLAVTAPVTVDAQSKAKICEGVGLVGGGNGCDQPADQPSVNSTIANAINIFSIVVGVISVIMIIIGGLKYITSAGDSGKVSSAKDTILYAVIGLVVVALAQVIVRFVLNTVVQGTPAP
jgi:hypothetical protein